MSLHGECEEKEAAAVPLRKYISNEISFTEIISDIPLKALELEVGVSFIRVRRKKLH